MLTDGQHAYRTFDCPMVGFWLSHFPDPAQLPMCPYVQRIDELTRKAQAVVEAAILLETDPSVTAVSAYVDSMEALHVYLTVQEAHSE